MKRISKNWTGIVTDVDGNNFWAVLLDCGAPQEVIEMSLDKIRELERDQIVVGAVFYWCIAVNEDGSDPMSIISLAKRPRWTESMMAQIKSNANKLFEGLV